MTLKKYPRTPHLPFSLGSTDDDKVLSNCDHFVDKQIVLTEKMDGECTSLYQDHIHARSLDSKDHPSRHWVKQFWSQIKQDIPEGWRVCGENVFAQHSISYQKLPSYFLGFSIWDDNNFCLAWDETLEWFQLLGITSVPVLYKGPFDESAIHSFWNEEQLLRTLYPDIDQIEGCVVRLASSFKYEDFATSVAKVVRVNHVTTDSHWMHKEIIQNKLV